METFVTVIHVIVCFFLILVILLQAGKGAGMGFLGGTGQTVFGGRGPATFLGKLTGIMAGLFMLTSMVLAWTASHQEDKGLKRRAETEQTERSAATMGAESTAETSAAPSASEGETPTPSEVTAADEDSAAVPSPEPTAPNGMGSPPEGT